MIELHPDFSDFLKLLNSNGVRYLVVGGYAVGYHGYPRATGDLDIWVAVDAENADKIVRAIHEFGVTADPAPKELFLEPGKAIRMGFPPVRIELITGVSGVTFDECYAQRDICETSGITVDMISLSKLKTSQEYLKS